MGMIGILECLFKKIKCTLGVFSNLIIDSDVRILLIHPLECLRTDITCFAVDDLFEDFGSNILKY